MKKNVFYFIFLIYSFSVFSFEGVNYKKNFKNLNFKEGDAYMFKELVTNTLECKNGGAVVMFNGADAMNFCVGSNEKNVYKYQKCFGKEVGSFPFPKICLGIKREVELVKIKEVIRDNTNGSIVLVERDIDDNQLYFERKYTFSGLNEQKLKLISSYSDKRSGRSGRSEYFFDTQDGLK